RVPIHLLRICYYLLLGMIRRSAVAETRFKDIFLDCEKVQSALVDAGATDLAERVVREGRLTHHSGELNGNRFLVQIFVKDGGKCTIGNSAGFDAATFEVLGDAIKHRCGYGSPSPLNVSLPRFRNEQLTSVLDYLAEQGVEISSDEVTANYRLIRIIGPSRDRLTFKHFNNGTFQMQGVHGQVAGWALDAVQAMLPVDTILAHQKDIYSVPLSVEEIKQNLEVRIPVAHGYLRDPVRIQFSSSLALTQVGIALEDYSAVAYPALRGLEGYCFQLLNEEVGVALGVREKLGEYFDQEAPTLRVLSSYEATCSPAVHQTLVEGYKLWHNLRHRLFHMDGNVDTTRMLKNREEAVAIVDEVFSLVESGHQRVSRSKGTVCESLSS
ncbi:RNase LS family HEPN domain-containing protein, partial [Xanthomonas axonopodis]